MQTKYFKTPYGVVKAMREDAPQMVTTIAENGDVVQAPVSLDWPEGEEITQQDYESAVKEKDETWQARLEEQQVAHNEQRQSALAKLEKLGLTLDDIKVLVR